MVTSTILVLQHTLKPYGLKRCRALEQKNILGGYIGCCLILYYNQKLLVLYKQKKKKMQST